jgi:UDP-N-acetylmuramyl pentapeptide phosphotransferase/UDP-N-acetylglucosamine-1-phosphate transferase
MTGDEALWLWAGVGALVAAAVLSFGLIALLRPLLCRHALAQPNARSSHSAPTPQGGGIAVIATTLLVTGGGVAALGETSATAEVFAVLAAGAFIAVVGGIDDLRPLPVVPRLVLQAIAIALAIAAMPAIYRGGPSACAS